MRWIIAIVLSLGLAAGAYFGYASWTDYLGKRAELEHLNKVQRELESVKRQYEAQAAEVAKSNALWKHIHEVGLEPERWVTHSLAVSKTLTWEDFSHLILLSANTANKDGGYWFKPDRLRVVRVAGKQESQPAVGQGKTEPVQVGAEGTGKQIELYDATLQGKFLIRKQ